LQEKEKQFYLNYVGCKVAYLQRRRIDILEFYLNYVGCKENIKEVIA